MEQVFYVHKSSQRRMRNKLYKQSKKWQNNKNKIRLGWFLILGPIVPWSILFMWLGPILPSGWVDVVGGCSVMALEIITLVGAVMVLQYKKGTRIIDHRQNDELHFFDDHLEYRYRYPKSQSRYWTPRNPRATYILSMRYDEIQSLVHVTHLQKLVIWGHSYQKQTEDKPTPNCPKPISPEKYRTKITSIPLYFQDTDKILQAFRQHTGLNITETTDEPGVGIYENP